MLGKAAVAMWWDVAPEVRAEWEEWHTAEHMPERLAHPGLPARHALDRAFPAQPSYFVLYEVKEPGDAHRRGVPRAAEQSHAVVAQDDAAPSQHGAQPVRSASQLGRRVAAVLGDDPFLGSNRFARASAAATASPARICSYPCRWPACHRPRSRKSAAATRPPTGCCSSAATIRKPSRPATLPPGAVGFYRPAYSLSAGEIA